MRKNKTKDPYPITDVYHVTDTLVDAATVVVTDLCENLSNSIDTHCDDILENLKKINTKKFNSISVGNSADGIYPVWVGVDKFNKVRKIFANTNGGRFDFDREKTKKLVSWSWDKSDLNDQFFSKPNKNKNVKRQRLFDMEIKSNAIAIADHSGNFQFEHHDAVIEALNEKYFKINNIYQNNYPIGLFKFTYGGKEEPKPSSFKSSMIHKIKKVVNISDFKSVKYTEFLSKLLDEKSYPTKYIFEKYLLQEKDYRGNIQLKISDEKISGNYLSDRLPKALQILKKQNKILFGKNFKEVHEIRKSQFENFIISIIKDIEPQELNLPTFGKKKSKPEVKNNKLYYETPGLPYIQDTFYDGYKLKSEPSLLESAIIPVKNGKYPCYIHSYPDETDEDGFQYNNVYVVVEGLENCYLNRNSKGQIFFDKSFKESLFLKEHINKKSKNISIDKIDLRNSENLKELEKISFVEELELHGFQNIKNWDGLSKLKNLKRLKLVSCNVSFSTTENFFKNLYSLTNLEEFTIDDTCDIPTPLNKKKFSKDLYFKKLKSFEIDFREEWKKTDHENYPNYKGYGNDKVSPLSAYLPNIYNFPNFEKFKSLEKLRIYNYFDFDQKEGTLFNYEYGFEDYYQPINQLCKNSKIKDIWIYGYNFKQANELAGTRFLDAALKLTKDTTVKINGINKSTLKNISDKPISSTSIKINKLILVNKIEEFYGEKLISQENGAITLNYFSNLEDKENRGLLNDVLNQQIEEITIKPAYQFFRSENMYSNTFKPIEEHIKKNRKLKKIVIEFDENSVGDDYGDMVGSWSDWESEALSRFVFNLLSQNAHLRIIVNHPEFKKQIGKNVKFDKYFRLFNLYQIIADDRKTRNRFEILGFNTKEIDLHLNRFLLERINMLVVIEDNRGWNDSKNIRNVEFLSKAEIRDGSETCAFSEFTKKITPSYEGTKPYVVESKLLSSIFETGFYEYSDSKYWHFANQRIDDTYEGPIVLVKQSFLDKAKKTIFKNIKHYFYFAEVDYTYEDLRDTINYKRFWKKNEYFKLPKSVKFNKLETLNIFYGRDVKLDSLLQQTDCSNLKQLILHGCIGRDRALPKLPNLEILAILDKHNEKAKPFSKLSNLPKLKHLEFSGLFNYNDENTRWNTSEFDFTDIYKLSSLSYLKMRSVNPEYLPPLKTLKNLEELQLTFKLITADMNDDKGRIDENLMDKNFEFLNHLTKLKKLNLDIPHEVSNVKGSLLLSYVNRGIEELVLDLHYDDQKIDHGYESINYITKNFKNLKKLKLIMGRKENFETSTKKKLVYFRKTGESWQEGKEGPRPFVLDLGKFVALKKLEQISFDQIYSDDMGFKVVNPIQITKLKKIKKINIQDEKFSSEDLAKIRNITEGPRDKFLEACKKKDKSIKSEYDLPKKDRKKYDLLDEREIRFNATYDYKLAGDTIEDILEKRKKKKN